MSRCFSACRKQEKNNCKTRFCNYISGPKREFCRLTPTYIMNPEKNCMVTKKYTKKNAKYIINQFVNSNIKRKKINKATKKIKEFLAKKIKATKKLKNYLITEKEHKLAMESPRELKQMKLIPFNKVSEVVKKDKMYDPEIQFYFYSGSKNAPPGKGAREIIPSEFVKEYKDSLSEFPDFRKMLSNFAEAPFKLDGLTWNSVEHYYQASKFKINNPDFYRTFALESGSELSKDPVMAKSYGGKTGKYKGKKIREKSVVVDEDFFGPEQRGNKEMYDAQLAKFTQNENMRNMLLATKNAQLMHTVSRSSISIPFDNLVYFRTLMKEGTI